MYYRDTIRNNFRRSKSWENRESEDWKKYRFLAFTVMDWTFAGMNGTKVNKKLKSPESLFKLPTDAVKVEKSLSGEAANDFMKQIAKQK